MERRRAEKERREDKEKRRKEETSKKRMRGVKLEKKRTEQKRLHCPNCGRGFTPGRAHSKNEK
jgi:hypothetical protein